MGLRDFSAAWKRVRDNADKVMSVVAIADGDGDPLTISQSAFGEQLSAELVPVAQLKFTSGLLTAATVSEISGSAAITIADTNKAQAATGTTTGSCARLTSRRIVRYSPGQGVECRFTAVFAAGVAGTTQLAGFGSAEDAFGFGYNGTEFGILHRRDGLVEVRELTVTAGAGSTGNLTVTLNGGSGVTVGVTAGDTIGEVARKVADADYSGEGGGWRALYAGDRVCFVSVKAEARSGAYTLGVAATGVTGSYAQSVAGAAPTETWVAQADWSVDQADGTKTMPVLDPTKGNVFAISMQWLGYGTITFRAENPTTGKFTTLHRIVYANENTKTSIRQPDQPLLLEADNGATTADVSVQSPSMGAFNAGPRNFVNAPRSSVSNTVSIGTTAAPIISIRMAAVNPNGLPTKTRILVDELSFGNNGGKTAEFRLIRNPTLVGAPSWSAAGPDTSVQVDTSATATSGGTRLETVIIGAGQGLVVPTGDSGIEIGEILSPGDVLTIEAVLSSGAAADMQASFSFIDDV